MFVAGPPWWWCWWKRLQWGAWQWEVKLYHWGSPRGAVWGAVRVWESKLWRGQSQSAYKALLWGKVLVTLEYCQKRIKEFVCVCTFSQSVRPSGYLGSREIINYPQPTQQKPPLPPYIKPLLHLITHCFQTSVITWIASLYLLFVLLCSFDQTFGLE